MTARVREGVFFEPPKPLPRGPHQMPREQVQDAQRQRLMMAFTELLADRGYQAVRIIDIAKRAGVSNDAFYDVFANKEECATAAHDHFAAVLERRAYRVDVAPSPTWREFVLSSVGGYLETITADPVVARAFHLELDAVGATARQRRRAALMHFAETQMREQERLCASDPLLKQQPLIIHLGSVHGVRQLACDALEAESEPDFSVLIPDVVNWLVAAAYGDTKESSG